MKSILLVVACFSWAGVAVSAAAPVHAQALTTQVGTYAACSADNTASPWSGGCLVNQEYEPIEMYYTQTMKFVSETCNAGGCGPSDLTVRTDIVYAAGRKTATLSFTCGTSKRFYNLGSCAC
jgi:hypothetical protein